ncbi:MAG: hypothetical protein OXG62_05980 [Nitrospinae bacterium]|nr:hypothetical protein [Nitrospinota bacterium]
MERVRAGPAYPGLPQGALLRAVNQAAGCAAGAHLPAFAVKGSSRHGVCPEGRPTAFGFSGGGRGAARRNRAAARARRRA